MTIEVIKQEDLIRMSIDDLLKITKTNYVFVIFPRQPLTKGFEFRNIDGLTLDEIQKIFNKDSVVFIKITN